MCHQVVVYCVKWLTLCSSGSQTAAAPEVPSTHSVWVSQSRHQDSAGPQTAREVPLGERRGSQTQQLTGELACR